VGMKGEIAPRVAGYAFMFDLAKVLEFKDTVATVANQDPPPSDPMRPETVTTKQPVSPVSALQDIYATFMTAYADVSLGQFKIPVSWEGYNSSSRLLFAERALASREFGDKRDLGLRLAKTWTHAGYQLGLYNGATLNNLDTNNAKDASLRIEVFPVPGLMVGAMAYGTVGDRARPATKDRLEGDLRYERGPFLFQGEFIRAHDVTSGGADVSAHGFYAALAWTFIEMIQPCVRLGYLDPDAGKNLDPAADKGKDEAWHIDGGLNVYLRKHEAKLQLHYARIQYDDRTAANQGILAAQVSY